MANTVTLTSAIKAAKEAKTPVLKYVKSLDSKSYDETLTGRNVSWFKEDIVSQISAKQRKIVMSEDSKLDLVRNSSIDTEGERMDLLIAVSKVDVAIATLKAEIESLTKFQKDFLG